jgi:hypothetical protein
MTMPLFALRTSASTFEVRQFGVAAIVFAQLNEDMMWPRRLVRSREDSFLRLDLDTSRNHFDAAIIRPMARAPAINTSIRPNPACSFAFIRAAPNHYQNRSGIIEPSGILPVIYIFGQESV